MSEAIYAGPDRQAWYFKPYWADDYDVRVSIFGPDFWRVTKEEFDRRLALGEYHMAQIMYQYPGMIGDDSEGIR